MLKYPKVPRVGIDIEPDGFWNQELIVTEKADGSLFRFCVYFEDYESWYPSEVTRLDPSHGDVVAGSSSSVRWVISERGIRGETETDFEPVLSQMQKIDTQEVANQYEKYGPLVYFGEAMTGHLLDYESAPEFLGFDIYSPEKEGRDDLGTPESLEEVLDVTQSNGNSNKNKSMADVYEASDWAGFLKTHNSMELFTDIGLEPMHYSEAVPTVDGSDLEPANIIIPQSQFATVKAEGVVLRSPSYRLKVRSDMFKEVRSHYSNTPSGGDADPTSRFINQYATPVRIMKVANKIAEERDISVSVEHTDTVAEAVWDDIWAEEWRTIKQKSYPIKNSEIRGEIKGKTAKTLMEVEDNNIQLKSEQNSHQPIVSFHRE